MDLNTSVLLGLVAILALNQALVRIPALERRSTLFWGLQFLDIFIGSAVLIFGLPGFEHAPAVGWVVGLLFVMHVAQNMKIRSDRKQEERRAMIDEEREIERKRRRDRDYDEEEAERLQAESNDG